jgi:hypothetical protein
VAYYICSYHIAGTEENKETILLGGNLTEFLKKHVFQKLNGYRYSNFHGPD